MNADSGMAIWLDAAEALEIDRSQRAYLSAWTPATRENPSGTAQALLESTGHLLARAAGFLSGDMTLILTSQGVQASKGVRNAAKASSAVRPFEEILKVRPGITGSAQAGRASASQEAPPAMHAPEVLRDSGL